MKRLTSTLCKGHSFAQTTTRHMIMAATLFFMGFLFTSCQKESLQPASTEMVQAKAVQSESNVLTSYQGLGTQTMWELQQARAATARYRHLKNAEKDGYVNINVVAPNMGYHYMKPSLVDGNFNYAEPEILVYNRDDDGNFYLVAVEYAVPLNLPQPAGFTGSHDVWNGNTGFQLWLLHAWVWMYNPAGVFNPTNADVHVH